MLLPSASAVAGRIQCGQKDTRLVHLDHQLLSQARRLLNGTDVHRLKELIFAYEQAVDLHNRQHSGHEVYRMQSEARLRLYMCKQKQEEIERRTFAAIERAKQASIKSEALAKHYDRLEEKFANWAQKENFKRIA
jgi:hypothetical protein